MSEYNKKRAEEHPKTFWPALEVIVKDFQKEKGLRRDGLLGPKTEGAAGIYPPDEDKIPDKYDDLFRELAPDWMDWRWLKALGYCESGLDRLNVTGRARGLFQCFPENFKDAGYSYHLQWSVPDVNTKVYIDTATRIRKVYLALCEKYSLTVWRFDRPMEQWRAGELRLFIAGWNSGYGDIKRYTERHMHFPHPIHLEMRADGFPKYRWSQSKELWQSWVLSVYEDLKDDGLYNKSAG